MTFEFLEQFTKRMKSVGSHALIHKNSIQKTTWKNFGFDQWYEQVNLIFMILLFIMEQSLKDEPCTMDTIGEFIDDLNRRYLGKTLSYEESKDLADFIVNTILCDEGRAMYFNGFNFETEKYEPIHMSYIGNKVIYIEGEVKRTSYYLTTDGYNFVLSTLEIESNLKLTIQEMIFRLHLEKASYAQAVDDVKSIFNSLRIKLQEIQEAMGKVRQNALSYSIEDYRKLQEDTLGALESTKKKYEGYKKIVRETIEELESEHINVKKLDEKQQANLTHLRTIESYLARAIQEQQRILGMHFDLKTLYEKELEGISAMSLIKRFSLEKEVYQKILKDPRNLEHMDMFLRPLFNQDILPSYNINLAFLEQKLIRKKKVEEETLLSFEEDLWQEEKLKERRAKLRKYKLVVHTLLTFMIERETTSLKEVQQVFEGTALLEQLIPTVEIFREVIIELIKAKQIDIEELRVEKSTYIEDSTLEFQLNQIILQLIKEDRTLDGFRYIEVYKANDTETVIFSNLKSEKGVVKQVKCSNVLMIIRR